ncbi:unnamed protein product [Durusdinium trenchii]|uniref:EF-hand domain-containing protein n=1 Tax=Durusdinium trenchii TaxID=1381693 RepID=A0ABP0S0U2_9DINO
MYLQEDVEAGRKSKPGTSPFRSTTQREAEARLANLPEERKRKKFLEDFRRREERFQRCQQSGADYKGFRRSNYDAHKEAHMRRAVLGSTDGFSIKGLSQSHGQPVPEQTLRKAFREIDSDQDGLISVRALTRALRRCGVDASKKTVERILQDCGYDQKGELQVEQFIRFFRRAALSWKKRRCHG